MSNEDATSSDADEVVHDESETEVANEAYTSDDDQADDTTDLEEGSPEDDSEDVEFEGKTYRLPKELKEGLLRTADYTRKTQEVAEAKRAIESERVALVQAQHAQEALIKEHATVKNLEEYVNYYNNVDWDAAEEQNPEVAQKEWRRYQQFQRQLDAAKTELETKKTSLKEQQAHSQAQALQETGKVLTRDIKGFNEQMAQELINTAGRFGFTKDDMLNDPDPRAWKIVHALHEALKKTSKQAVGDRAQAQAKTAPIKVVGAKSAPATGLSDRASTKAWMEARNKQTRR